MNDKITNQVLHSIRNRRSIRKFKSVPVEPQMLDTIIEAACWAPSWTNIQCWRFVVVTQPGLKEQIVLSMGNNRGSEGARQAPVMIVLCAEIGRSGWYKGTPVTDSNRWHVFDAALCMQNLALAAYSLGLATVIIGYFDTNRVAELIQLPEGFEVIAMTPLGYPDEVPDPPPRNNLESIRYYNSFGETGTW